jgi:hypothetical protein
MSKLASPLARLLVALIFAALSPLASGAVVISEFMASNDRTITDEDGDDEDWLELHNDGPAAVDITGWFLTDDSADLTQWQLPARTLPAGGYLLVFASNKDRAPVAGELHANFKLSAGGEYLALVAADGTTVVDDYAPEYPQQFTDVGFGGGLYYPDPTPGAANGAGVDGLVEEVALSVPHGFYDSAQTVALTSATAGTTIRYTLDGRTPSSAAGCTAPANGDAWGWEYYEGTWTTLPDFDALTPVAAGTADVMSIEPRQRDSNYGLRFSGCVDAKVAGLYTFEASSDDGSQVWVDGALVVDNDGIHPTQSVSQTIYLERGLHRVVTTMFQGGGGASLSTSWNAPHRSNGYLTSVDNGVFYTADPNSQNVIELPFFSPADGDFQFDALAQGVSGSSNSFWVQLDNGPLWQFGVGQPGALSVYPVTDGSTVVQVSLQAGDHVLRVFPREDGARLGSITVKGVNCAGACENQLLEAEAGNYAGIWVPAGVASETTLAARWHTYSAPLSIDSTTALRAVAVRDNYLPSPTATATYLFLDDIVGQSPNEEPPPGWPAGPVNGQDLDYGMDPAIVGPDPAAVRSSLASLPAIAISTDIDNLLHPEIGIYTNAFNKGRYWERPAAIELIDGSGAEQGFTQEAGIRVRGGFSRRPQNPKHSFRAFFRSAYGGDLEYPLFGDEGVEVFQKIDFRSSNNYSWAQSTGSGGGRNTLLREVWSRDTQRDMGLAHTRSRYYNLYINGVYWGVFMTQERVSEEFAASYFGGDEDDYDVVKHNRSDGYRFEATDGTNAAWIGLFDYVADQNISSGEYAAIDATVDLENLIDYIMINAYEGDTDGSPSSFLSGFKRGNNWYGIQDRVGDKTKWRFFQHDGEHALGARRNASLENNLLGPYPPFNGQPNEFFNNAYFHPYWLHAALTSNAEYRQRFIDHASRRFRNGGALTDAAALARWNARKAQMSSAVLAHSARWGDSKRSTPFTLTDWQNEVSYVENTVIPGRSGTVYAQMVALGLASELPTAQVSVPSDTLIAPGTEIVIAAPPGTQLYYTLDGSDPRLAGGAIAPGAQLIAGGDSIVISADATLVLRAYDAGSWGPETTARYTTNEIPVIDEVDSQFTAISDVVSLQLSATDDDALLWSASGLPDGLAIDSASGLVSGVPTQLGSYSPVVTVDDGDVSVDETLSWEVLPPAPLILNEYNAVSGSKFLGGGDGTAATPEDSRLGRIQGNGGDWFELVVTQDRLDIRGWELRIEDDGAAQPVLTFSADPLWSDLRAGTIITVAEGAILAADSSVYDEDVSYDPAADDWWIHVVAGDAGSGSYITATNYAVSNDSWQLSIADAGGAVVFGPAGEGIGSFSGVNSEEVGKLEANPGPLVTQGSAYDDGTSSTFGAPNRYAGGTAEQDFNTLRPVVDSAPTLTVSDASAGEGGFLRFEIALSAPASQEVSFDIATDSLDADLSDYETKGGARFIPAGNTSITIWVATTDDAEAESDETVRLTVSNLVGAQPEDLQGEGTIIDNDSGGALPALSIADASTVEGGFARFVLSLSAASAVPVDFVLSTTGQSATVDADFLPKNGVRSIAAGETEFTVWVSTLDDSESESTETFQLGIESAVNATVVNSSATGTIVDNDGGAVLPALSIGDASAVEGGFVRFPISLSAASTLPVSFVVSTSDVTANVGIDYQPKSGVRTIAAGETEFTLWVPTIDDSDTEGEESFAASLSAVSGATLADGEAVGSILDNEGIASPSLTISDAVAVEGAAARIIVSLSAPSPVDTIIAIETIDESATGGDVDYQSKGGARVIPAGSTELVLWVPLREDALVEGTETFRLEVTDAGAATIVDGSSMVTITDND